MPINYPKYQGSKVDYAAMAKNIREVFDNRDKDLNDKIDKMYQSLLTGGKGAGEFIHGRKAALEARLNEAIESGDPDLIQAAYKDIEDSWLLGDKEKNYLNVKKARAMGMSPNFDGVI